VFVCKLCCAYRRAVFGKPLFFGEISATGHQAFYAHEQQQTRELERFELIVSELRRRFTGVKEFGLELSGCLDEITQNVSVLSSDTNN
jgi:hypothetical protein